MSRWLILFLFLFKAALSAQVPAWANTLPQEQHRLYAVGVEALQEDEARARMKAGQLARLELLIRLRSRARGQLSSQSSVRSTWDEGIGPSHGSVGSFSTRIDIQAFAASLPGVEIQEVVVDRTHGQVFALAVLDMIWASAAHCQTGQVLQGQITASLSEPAQNTWKDRLRQFREIQSLNGTFAAWEDTRDLLAAGGVFPDRQGPDPILMRELLARTQVTVSLLETADLPVGLVSGLHEWRSRRRLAMPSPTTFCLSPEAISEWPRIMDLERIRAQWTLVLTSPEGDRLAVWSFEDQAVGATRAEAMQHLLGVLLPRMNESLDRWFGFPVPPTSIQEAS